MCCKTLSGNTCGTTIVSIPCEEDPPITGTWTPGFSGTYGSSTYTSQTGSFITTSKYLHVNFCIIVSAYSGASDPSIIEIPLPYMTSSSLTQNQFFNLNVYQGIGAGEFTPLPIFGTIAPGSQLLTISTNFIIASGDKWVGNFTLVLA